MRSSAKYTSRAEHCDTIMRSHPAQLFSSRVSEEPGLTGNGLAVSPTNIQGINEQSSSVLDSLLAEKQWLEGALSKRIQVRRKRRFKSYRYQHAPIHPCVGHFTIADAERRNTLQLMIWSRPYITFH
jgi:hypothetical protein